MKNLIDYKKIHGYEKALENLKDKWAHLFMNGKLMNEDTLPTGFQQDLSIFLLGYNCK